MMTMMRATSRKGDNESKLLRITGRISYVHKYTLLPARTSTPPAPILTRDKGFVVWAKAEKKKCRAAWVSTDEKMAWRCGVCLIPIPPFFSARFFYQLKNKVYSDDTACVCVFSLLLMCSSAAQGRMCRCYLHRCCTVQRNRSTYVVRKDEAGS